MGSTTSGSKMYPIRRFRTLESNIKVTSTAICGSDLHLYDGLLQTMEGGDILGHEFMGEVVDLGPEVRNLQVGDRVAVPFVIACGHCLFRSQQLYSACDTSNPNPDITEMLYGAKGAGMFGYSHMYGGFAGGQAHSLPWRWHDASDSSGPSLVWSPQRALSLI
jgi:threonine dehydrogenase-like Zn-dependent dehydrogenase